MKNREKKNLLFLFSTFIIMCLILSNICITNASADESELVNKNCMIILDNGKYDDKFISDFGSVTYSTDGINYNSINMNTENTNDNMYKILCDEEVKIKCEFSKNNMQLFIDGKPVDYNEIVLKAGEGVHIQFQDKGNNGPIGNEDQSNNGQNHNGLIKIDGEVKADEVNNITSCTENDYSINKVGNQYEMTINNNATIGKIEARNVWLTIRIKKDGIEEGNAIVDSISSDSNVSFYEGNCNINYNLSALSLEIEGANVKVNGVFKADSAFVSYGTLTVLSDNLQTAEDTALSVKNQILVGGNGKITVSSNCKDAISVNSVEVEYGGIFHVNYSDNLGTINIKKSNYIPYCDNVDTNVGKTITVGVDDILDIDKASYSITESDKTYEFKSTQKPLYNIMWSSNKEFSNEDFFVENGSVELRAATGFKRDNGNYLIEAGTEVTIYLKPDYGYQFTSGQLNGSTVTAGEEISSFKFIMPETQLHLSTLFTKTSDKTIVNDNSIKNAAINETSNIINSGNVELVVNPSKINDTEKNNIAQKLQGCEAFTYVDLSLNNVIYKGNTEASWERPLTELNSDVKITLALSDELKGKDSYKIIREHNGQYDEVPAEYNESDNTITFCSNKFSTYAIAALDDTNKVQDATSTVKDGTGTVEDGTSTVKNGTGTVEDGINSGDKTRSFAISFILISSLSLMVVGLKKYNSK